jgi:hypothetical protein
MLFVVSAALIRTGALSFIVNAFVKLTGGKPFLLMLLMVGVVITLSAFLNNTPVVIIFISIILMICERFRLVPSKFLIPLSYASILGGTCTLIGTSTNIILSDMMVLNGQKALGFFELSIVGVPVAIVGGSFWWSSLPGYCLTASHVLSSGDVQAKTYISELRVLEGGPFPARGRTTSSPELAQASSFSRSPGGAGGVPARKRRHRPQIRRRNRGGNRSRQADQPVEQECRRPAKRL